MADSAITIPNHVSTKADFDQWLEHDVGDKLTTTQRDALKTDISAKLGLDMGNAITPFGRAEINKDLKYFLDNPTATSIPNLDPDLPVGDPKGPNNFNELRNRSNQFSDPFLIDLTSILALMHETSEKLRTATKELRQAEHNNSQAQMQASAANILSQGAFQATSGAISAAFSIGGGAAGIKSAGGGINQIKNLNTQVKQGLDYGPDPSTTPKLDQPKPLETSKVDTSKKTSVDGDEVQSLKDMVQKDLPSIEKGLDKLDPNKSPGGGWVSAKPSGTDRPDGPTIGANRDQVKSDLDGVKQKLDNPPEPGKLTKVEYDLKFQQIQLVSQKWQAVGTMVDGFGKALGAAFTGAAAQHEAAKAIDDKEAAESQHQKETTNDLVKTLTDFSQQIRQVVQSIISSQDQAAHRVANV